MESGQLELFCRCAWGFERLLSDELGELGLRHVRPLHGGVAFAGDLRDAYTACMWSRVATRVQLVLSRVAASDADALYEGAKAFPWEDHVRPGATIAVEAHGQNDNLRNTLFTALKVKDALCDRLREVRGFRPDVDAKHPGFAINVAVHQSKATLYLNLSGESLHRRGYREDGVQTEAPLKETLAAAVVLLSGWREADAAGGVLVDPMCGSGTLAIEAAMMSAGIAPGVLRGRWGFEGWLGHDEHVWDQVKAEACDVGAAWDSNVRVIAGDVDPLAVEIARANARRAGVDGLVRFHVGDAAQLERRVKWLRGRDLPGVLVTNPPYGQRLLSHEDLPTVYAALHKAVGALPQGWGVTVLTPDAGIDSALGRLPYKTTACYNGPIEAWIRSYATDEPARTARVVSLAGQQLDVPVSDANGPQFAARLRKVARDLVRRAKREGIPCFRAYDGDLPEYPYAVDVFDCEEGRLLRVEELLRPRRADAQLAARHAYDVWALAAATLDVSMSNVTLLRWRQENRPRRLAAIAERGLRYELDLGSSQAARFVAQREAREFVSTTAKGRRVACLFATGGALCVCAAGAGASEVVAVDGSKGHLDGVRDAMRKNGFVAKRYRYACSEVRSWLAAENAAHRTYDLVVCDAPTWLPAMDAGGRDWDAERDLSSLLASAKRVLSSQGLIVRIYEADELTIPHRGYSVVRKGE